MKLRNMLKLLLEQLPTPLTYVMEDEVMKITTVEKANEKLQIRMYPVGDLVYGPASAQDARPWRRRQVRAWGGGMGGGGMGGGGMGWRQAVGMAVAAWVAAFSVPPERRAPAHVQAVPQPKCFSTRSPSPVGHGASGRLVVRLHK